jgi:hypothetical protein
MKFSLLRIIKEKNKKKNTRWFTMNNEPDQILDATNITFSQLTLQNFFKK